MTDQSDKVEISVGQSGIKVGAHGSGASRLAHALADLLSPLTEGAGVLGDSLRLRRVQSAIRSLQAAHAAAEASGLPLKPVAPKFLVQWLEHASLEDEQNEELTELWGKLLAAASANPINAKNSYLDFLNKIGKEEASLLQYLAHDTNPDFSREFYRLTQNRNLCEKVAEIAREREIEIGSQKFMELAEGVALQLNCILLYVNRPDTLSRPTEFFEDHEKSVSILEREGAVKVCIDGSPLIELEFDLCWMQLTKFGFDFVYACEGHVPNNGLQLSAYRKPSEQS
jgi:hypothetical protein